MTTFEEQKEIDRAVLCSSSLRVDPALKAARRTDALQIACEMVGPKVFNPNTKDDVDGRDVAELYEIAEYNYRFIMEEDLGIDKRSSGDKIACRRQDVTKRAVANMESKNGG